MPAVLELRRRRNEAIAAARAVIEGAEAEGRELSAEERESFDRAMDDEARLAGEIEDAERHERMLARLAGAEAELAAPQGPLVAHRTEASGGALNVTAGPTVTAAAGAEGTEVRTAWQRFLRHGPARLTDVEVRTLQATVDTHGGFLVAPQFWVATLMQAVDDLVFVRSAATRFSVERAESLGAPSLDTDLTDAEWTSELATGSLDTALRVGRRELAPAPLAKRVRVSNRLLRQSTIDVEALVQQRLAYRFAAAEERAFMVGHGSGQPLGVFTASAMGISTARDVVAGSATDFTFDGLIAVKYALKAQYHRRAAWLIHRDGVRRIATLKDGQGQYLWRESTRAGEPDRLLGFPVHTSEFAPATFTTGLYVGMLADWSHYWVVDALDTQVQRLTELYAESNEVGFIARRELDGMPAIEEAFVRARLA